jgi:hypothetical protein
MARHYDYEGTKATCHAHPKHVELAATVLNQMTSLGMVTAKNMSTVPLSHLLNGSVSKQN